MKRGTISHPKLYTLAALLDVPRWGAVGILESLWHFAQSYAQDGAVGRYPDEAIARAIGWEANAATLVTGLAKSGWIDRCHCHRARIHDWPEHADQTVQRWLKERAQGFAECYDDPSTMLAPDEPAVAVPCRAVAVPEPKPEPVARARRRPAIPSIDTEANREVVDAYNSAFGSRIEYTNGNLQAAQRAYEAGYTLDQFRQVFRAVVDGSTPTGLWCKNQNHGFDYLIRPPYKHGRTKETTLGPLDKVLNELAGGTRVNLSKGPPRSEKENRSLGRAMRLAGIGGLDAGQQRDVGPRDVGAGATALAGGGPGNGDPPGGRLPEGTPALPDGSRVDPRRE